MATLILTAVGSAVGGPIGGALGALVGQQLDAAIFAPKARHGPRLGDLTVQTSSYGTALPKIFGTMRVAGTVIWATDLIESRAESGGGKGRPKTVSYSYSASFAVALSARPIRSVRRIWADGKLLRGIAGDFKSATVFRLHPGDEDQAVDPMIAAAEGIGETPAFRGLAYAAFENLQLEDFGNRIPSLTFEVEADPGPVTIGEVAAELSGGAVSALSTPALTGYAAGGDSVRAALEALADAVPLSLSDTGETLRLGATAGPPALLAADEENGRRELVRRASDGVPDEVSLAYYEPARDFQTGLQRAALGTPGGGRSVDRRALPAALSAEAAKALAEFRLAALRTGRVSARIELGWAQCGLKPGSHVRIEGEAGLWRVRRWTLGAMTVALELLRVSGAPLPAPVAAHPGRPVSEPDLVHGPTVVHLHDLPLGDPSGARPLLLAVASGSEPGWRRAALTVSFDGGERWQAAGATAAPAVMGEAVSVLAGAGSTLIDAASDVEIELLHSAMWLENASDDALVGGANLALLGDELIQFGRAEWLGGRRFRLARLLRGRRGTEWAAAGHAAGEPFCLIERATAAAIEAPAGSLGGEALLSAVGVGDAEAATASAAIHGESLRPPSPVHLRAERLDGGDILVQWVRRSRQGWSWPSGAGDTPLGEESEAYRLAISGEGVERTAFPVEPRYLYTAAEQAEDGAAGSLQLAVVQIGAFAPSRPATVTLV